VTDIPTVLQRIGSDFPAFRPDPSPAKERTVASAFEKLRVSPLKNTVLLDYLGTRGIPSDIASRECVEVHYRMYGKWYFAIGFKNRKGGLEIRNPYFKGAVSPKDITHVSHNTGDRRQSSVLVFEGFMDYLSYLALKKGQAVPDCVVLNSVTNLPKAMDILRSYGQVCYFLDNDEVGRKAVEEIRKQCGKISDKAIHYLPHKDLNEFLQERIRSERMTVRQGAKNQEG